MVLIHLLPSQANFEHGFGVVDSGGFVKCDLAADGRTMAGCTAKGHLIQWDINTELRKGPNGQMLYQWLASMPNASARAAYGKLMEHYPLMYNVQDSRGWTVLMHAAEDSNAEVIIHPLPVLKVLDMIRVYLFFSGDQAHRGQYPPFLWKPGSARIAPSSVGGSVKKARAVLHQIAWKRGDGFGEKQCGSQRY